MKRTATWAAAAALIVLMSGCVSTHTLQSRDLPLPARQAPATPHALGDIVVTSEDTGFNSDSERRNIENGLRIAVTTANLFGADRAQMYRLSVTVMQFDIPLMDQGPFPSSLVMRYALTDAAGKTVLQTTLRSVGRDDTGSFLGNTRARRSRTVAVTENIYSFVRLLDQRLDPKARPLFSP
jgi:hypothetical protein